jgi:hypothetical protein
MSEKMQQQASFFLKKRYAFSKLITTFVVN